MALRALLLASLLGLAPVSAEAAPQVTLHGGGKRNVELGTNSGGIPFLWGVYGTAPVLYGRATGDGVSPASGAYVNVLYREIRPHSAWHKVGHAVTAEDGTFRVQPDGLRPGFYPRRTGVFRAALARFNADVGPATSGLVGFFVVPRLQLVSAARQQGGWLRVEGRVAGALGGGVRLDGPHVDRRAALGKGSGFSFRVRTPGPGTYRYLLSYAPRAGVLGGGGSERTLTVTVPRPPPPPPPPPRSVGAARGEAPVRTPRTPRKATGTAAPPDSSPPANVDPVSDRPAAVSTPAQTTPAQSTPAQSTPAQSTPAQTTPAAPAVTTKPGPTRPTEPLLPDVHF